MEETLHISLVCVFTRTVPAAEIPSLLLLICSCEKNISDAVAEVLITITNMLTQKIGGVKKNYGNPIQTPNHS